MDLTFVCPNCRQELEADTSLAGTKIQCPSCAHSITIPDPDPATIKVMNPIASSAAAREEKHFSVPVHDSPTEVLIQKPPPPLEVTAKETEKRVRVKTIRRTDCMELGHDNFDKIVSDVLAKIGQENIISINTLSYTHLDIGSQKLLTDFGVMIVFKG